jgi:hypothetical protein
MQRQIGPATILGDCRVDNLLPPRHFWEPRVVMRHEGAHEYRGLVELGREAFQASVGPLLDQSN